MSRFNAVNVLFNLLSVFILCLLRVTSISAQPLEVTDIIDMEVGTGNEQILTPSLANFATNQGVGNASGTFQLSPSAAATDLFISTKFASTRPVRGPVKIRNKIFYDNNSTRNLRKHVDDKSYEFVTYQLAPTKAKVLLGFFIYFSSDGDGWRGNTYESYDLFAMTATDGMYHVLNTFDGLAQGKPLQLNSHTNPAPCSGGLLVTLAGVNQWYWVTMSWDAPNHQAKMAIFDANTWTQLGSTTTCDTQSTNSLSQIFLGQSDRHSHQPRNAGSDYYMDDLIIDANGINSFPLLPKPAPSSPLNVKVAP